MYPEFISEKPYPTVRQVLSLAIVWSAREPHRIGELALFQPEERLWVLGRNPLSLAPGMQLHMRGRVVSFFRQRPPGALDRSQPAERGALIAGEGISRRQIEICVQQETLRIKNIGRCALRVNGVAVSEALVRPHDTVSLHDQIMLYCCWRPLEMAPLRVYPSERASYFGEPDQDGLIGESPAIWELRERLALAAGMHRPVVIKGACRIARAQAERALSAMVAQSIFAPVAAHRNVMSAHKLDETALGGRSLATPAEQVAGMGLAATEPRFQQVEVPDLNDRPEDIPFILNHILRQQANDGAEDLSSYFYMGLPRVHPSMIETLLHQFYSNHIAQLTETARQALGDRVRDARGPRPPRSNDLSAPARPSRPESEPTMGNRLEQKTLAMLLREGLAVPNAWAARDGSRDSG
jgi:hypothetical protein